MIGKIIAALIIFLFIYTATDKLSDHSGFRSVLAASPIIAGKASLLAWVIPVVELMIAALLLMPPTMRMGFYCSSALLVVFTFYIAYMIYFTPNRPCSCGGVLAQLSWKQHLLFNVPFVFLSIAGTRITGRQNLSNH